MNIMDKLANRAKIVGPVCVGLDTKLEFIPKCISALRVSIYSNSTNA